MWHVRCGIGSLGPAWHTGDGQTGYRESSQSPNQLQNLTYELPDGNILTCRQTLLMRRSVPYDTELKSIAAVRDSLDVPAPGDCSSAIKPKIEHKCPSSCQRSRFWSSRSDVGHRRWPGFWRHGAVQKVSRNFGIFCFSMFALCPQVSVVCPSAITWASGVTPYAEDKTERLMATTGLFLEDIIALLRQRNT